MEILKPEAVRHWRLLDKAEEIMEALKKVEQKPPSKEEFRSVVQGCASSGNWQKLSEILGELSQILERGTEEQRHRVLEYLTGMMGAVSSNTPERFLRSLVEHSQNFYLRAPTRESESLLLELARELILLDYLAMAREVLSILRDQREAGDLDGPTSEREPLTDTIDPAVVDKLLSEICKGKSESAGAGGGPDFDHGQQRGLQRADGDIHQRR